MKYLSLICLWLIVIITPALGREPTAPGDNPSFVTIDTMIISILQGPKVSGLMSVTVRLQLEDEGDREDVEFLRPKLRDRYLSLLSRLGSASIDIDRPLNVPRLQNILQRATDKVVGEDKALVLITDASTRAL